MDIDKAIEEILRGVDPSWSTIYKIRYGYLEMGKRLSKDVDWYFSQQDKLGTLNLTPEEMVEVYDSNFGRDGKILCRSASLALKALYDRMGIKSKMIRYTMPIYWEKGNDKKLYHWFLAVEDGNRTIFLNLMADLYNIQMGLKTEHFGDLSRHTKKIGDRMQQMYEGDPINESSISDEELYNMDLVLGYVKNYYSRNRNSIVSGDYVKDYEDASLVMLSKSIHGNKLYHSLLISNSDFYNYYLKIKGANNRIYDLFGNKLTDIPDSILSLWKRKICMVVSRKIEKMIGFEFDLVSLLDGQGWDYDLWLKKICILCEREIIAYYNNGNDNVEELRLDPQNFIYKKWSAKIKKTLNVDYDNNDYDSILLILDKVNALMKAVDRKDTKSFNNLYSLLAFHFLPSSLLYEKNLDDSSYLSNYYVANKFRVMFAHIFSCNSIRTSFNDMQYGEQLPIIKRVLEIIFYEINSENSAQADYYNYKYNAVMNRIQIYPIKNKITGDYCIVFNVIGDKDENDYYYFYNPKENIFKDADALEIYADYIVISDRMKLYAEKNGVSL